MASSSFLPSLPIYQASVWPSAVLNKPMATDGHATVQTASTGVLFRNRGGTAPPRGTSSTVASRSGGRRGCWRGTTSALATQSSSVQQSGFMVNCDFCDRSASAVSKYYTKRSRSHRASARVDHCAAACPLLWALLQLLRPETGRKYASSGKYDRSGRSRTSLGSFGGSRFGEHKMTLPAEAIIKLPNGAIAI